MLKYEGNDYDLNHLFQFELLKQLLEALAKNQMQLDAKIKGMTRSDFDLKDTSQDNYAQEGEGDVGVDEDSGNIDNKSLMKRLLMMERKVNYIKRLEKQIRALDEKNESLNQIVLLTSSKVDNHDRDIIDIKRDITKLGKSMANITNRNNTNNDMSVKDSNDETATYDQTQGQIANLEQKVFKKFALVDERNKHIEEETNMIKGNIDNMLNHTDGINDQIAQMQKHINKTIDDILNERELRDKQMRELNDLMNANLIDMQKTIDTNNICLLNKIKESEENQMKNIGSSSNINNKGIKNISTDELKQADKDFSLRNINEMNTKVIEIEKELHMMKSLSSKDDLKGEITKLKEIMKTKLILSDLDCIYDKIANIGDKIDIIKDTDETQNKSLKTHSSDITSLWKKIEKVGSILGAMQEGDSNANSISNSKNLNEKGVGGVGGGDMHKHVESKAFNDEINEIKSRLTMMNRDIEEHRRYLNHLIPLSESVTNIGDLQRVEKQLTIFITESNMANSKKYADKNETNKSIKAIEAQLKHLMSEWMKNKEKSDHWILASKPMTNFKCASCENEIEDLNMNSKWEYLPWKKYPMREMAENTYRSGNGFSRMLQSMNLDLKKTKTEGSFSDPNDEEIQKESFAEKHKRNPSSHIQFNHLSTENLNTKHILTETNQKKITKKVHSQPKNIQIPKVVKIYKKIKEVNEDHNNQTNINERKINNKTNT